MLPGIAVSNHLSANDIMIIYADCEYHGVGYTVTGQRHRGFIDPLQKMGSKLTPSLWLDRASQTARTDFQKQVLDYSSNPTIYPVLLFPEGYCTNNDAVLQFRKAVFTGQVPIYPIAILQNTRLGDSFWREDKYIPYILRIMTSWAIAYDIIYLPPMEKKESEDVAAFASRVQSSIAGCIGKEALPYDGGLKREKERAKYKNRLQEVIAEVLI
uniref:PlsC domain-containing protein n=1 Tax=Heterorhabditis bacteriophora TaxID=37862 RepID=A0A1I7WMM2_HETBA